MRTYQQRLNATHYPGLLAEQAEKMLELGRVIEQAETLGLPESVVIAAGREIAAMQIRQDNTLGELTDVVKSIRDELETHASIFATLEQIAKALPASWQAKLVMRDYHSVVGKVQIDTACDVTLHLVYRHNTSSWKRRVIGTSLEVNAVFETRRFPQKKDGTYSVDKAIAFATEQLTNYAARIKRQLTQQERVTQFDALLRPYTGHQLYSLDTSLMAGETALHIIAKENGTFTINRTTTQQVTKDELETILASEVATRKGDC